jgi:hypothetical protein
MACNLYLTGSNNGAIFNGQPKPGGFPLTRETTDTSQTIWQIAANNVPGSANFICIAVGDGGAVLKSTRVSDTTCNWSTVYNAGVPMYGMAYGNGIWVGVGDNNTVIRSTNNGTSWTKSKGTTPSATWTWMTYGGGKFVAVGGARVGNDTKGAIMYSTDGITWTKGNAGTASLLHGVAYSPDLGIFVACGDNGALVSVEA